MKRRTIVGALSVLLLLAGLGWPAAAGPMPQTGTKSYRRAAWGLTLRYPADWSVEDLATDVVGLGSPGSGDDIGVLAVGRSTLYADPAYAPSDVFNDLMKRTDVTWQAFEPTDAEPRSIAGVDADVISFTATSKSGAELQGFVCRLSKGRMGYGIVTAAMASSWDQYQADFDAILDSIQIRETAVGKTPTATPTRKATPTRTPRRPTATPSPSPTATGAATHDMMTAREAYDVAWPEVELWSPDAVLSEASCDLDANWEGDDRGKCLEWDFYFLQSDGAGMDVPGYEVVVYAGQIDTLLGGEDYYFIEDSVGAEWVDTPDIVQAFLDHGGRAFLDQNVAHVSELRLYRGAGGAVWTVKAERASAELPSHLTLEFDAATGSVLATATPTPAATATRKPSTPGATPRATATATTHPAAESSAPGEIVFEDDFAGPSGYLGTYSGEDGKSEYADGFYKMTVISDSNYIHGSTYHQQYGAEPYLTLPEPDLDQVSIDVDVTQASGPRNGSYGVAIGFQSVQKFYAFLISGDGRRYAIARVYNPLVGGRAESFTSGFFWLAGQDRGQPHPAIKTGDNAVNHLRAECAGGGLVFYVNGQKVAETPLKGEERGLKGGLALVTQTDGAGPLEVDFSKLVVRRLPAPPVVQAARAGGQVLFQEDFAQPPRGWFTGVSKPGDATMTVAAGAYRVTLKPDGSYYSHVPSLAYGDVRAEVDVTALSGDDWAFAGLSVRSIGQGFYDFSISPGGQYYVDKMVPGKGYETLVDWSPSAAIKKGLKQTNRLRVDCLGNRLVLYVNGQKVAEIQDSDLPAGYVDLEAVTTKTQAAQFAFDNVVLRRP